MFLYRLQKLTKNQKIWTSFQFLGIIFYQLLSFSALRNWNVTSKTPLVEHAVLWSSNWGNTEERYYYWKSSTLQLNSLQEFKSQLFHLCFNQIRFTFKRVLFWKIGRFVSCVTIPTVREIRKMPTILIHLIVQSEFFHQIQVWVNQAESQVKALLL